MFVRVDRQVSERRGRSDRLSRIGRNNKKPQIEQVEKGRAEAPGEEVSLVVLLKVAIESVDELDIALDLDGVISLDVVDPEPGSPVEYQESVDVFPFVTVPTAIANLRRKR